MGGTRLFVILIFGGLLQPTLAGEPLTRPDHDFSAPGEALSLRPRLDWFNERIQVDCRGRNTAGELLVGTEGLSARFAQWGCQATEEFARPAERSASRFCGYETDFRGLHQGHFFYHENDKKWFHCTFRSGGGAESDYSVVFQSPLGPNGSLSCRATEDIQQVLYEHPGGFFFFENGAGERRVTGQWRGAGLEGWGSCRQNPATGALTFEGQCRLETENLELFCSRVQDRLNVECRAQGENCGLSCGYRDGAWSVQGEVSDVGYLSCSGEDTRLKSLAAEVWVPLTRIQAQCGIGAEYNVQTGLGLTTRLMFPCGQAFLEVRPQAQREGILNRPLLEPHEIFTPGPPDFLRLGVGVTY